MINRRLGVRAFSIATDMGGLAVALARRTLLAKQIASLVASTAMFAIRSDIHANALADA